MLSQPGFRLNMLVSFLRGFYLKSFSLLLCLESLINIRFKSKNSDIFYLKITEIILFLTKKAHSIVNCKWQTTVFHIKGLDMDWDLMMRYRKLKNIGFSPNSSTTLVNIIINFSIIINIIIVYCCWYCYYYFCYDHLPRFKLRHVYIKKKREKNMFCCWFVVMLMQCIHMYIN